MYTPWARLFLLELDSQSCALFFFLACILLEVTETFCQNMQKVFLRSAIFVWPQSSVGSIQLHLENSERTWKGVKEVDSFVKKKKKSGEGWTWVHIFCCGYGKLMLQVQLVFNQFLRNGSNGNSEDEIWKPPVTTEILEKHKLFPELKNAWCHVWKWIRLPAWKLCWAALLQKKRFCSQFTACLKAVLGSFIAEKALLFPVHTLIM